MTPNKQQPQTGAFYALIKVQNPYSSGDRDVHYAWYSNYEGEEMTRAEFCKAVRRVTIRIAEQYFYDIIKDGGTYKVFTDREKFRDAYKKATGNFPNFHDE